MSSGHRRGPEDTPPAAGPGAPQPPAGARPHPWEHELPGEAAATVTHPDAEPELDSPDDSGSFQDEISTAFERSSLELDGEGEGRAPVTSVSYEDKISTVSHAIAGLTPAPRAASWTEPGPAASRRADALADHEGFDEAGIDDPPTSPSHVIPEHRSQTEGEGRPPVPSPSVDGYEELDSEVFEVVDDGETEVGLEHARAVASAYRPPAPGVAARTDLPPARSFGAPGRAPHPDATEDLPDLTNLQEPGQAEPGESTLAGAGGDDTIIPEQGVAAIGTMAAAAADDAPAELREEETAAGTPAVLRARASGVTRLGSVDEGGYEALDAEDIEAADDLAALEREPDTLRKPKFIDAPTLESVVLEAAHGRGHAPEAAQVVAPSFGQPVELIREGRQPFGQSFGEKLSTAIISQRLRSQVVQVGAAAGPEPPAQTAGELDPRPFLESVRRDPRDRAAHAALRRIYGAGGRLEELVEALLELTERDESPEWRLPLLSEVARLFDESLGALDKAQVALISALLLDPSSEEIAEQLTAVTDRGGLWSGLFAELGGAVAQEAHAGRRAALCARLGDWYLRAGYLAYAIPCFQQALTADPRSLRAIVGMAIGFEQVGDAENLDLALAHIQPVFPPDTPVELMIRIAGLYERRGDDRAATSVLERALADHPGDEQLEGLVEALLERQQRWADLAAHLVRRAEAGAGPAAVDLWRRAAVLLATQVGDPRGAERAGREVLASAGDDAECLEILETLYSADSRWAELLWVLERRLEAAATPRERVGLLLRLAQIEAEELVRLEVAEQRLIHAVELEPRNLEAHGRLIDLLRRRQQWPALAEALERLSGAERDDAARAWRLVEAAKVWADELGQPVEAIEPLRRAQKLLPAEPAILGLLAEALLRGGDPAGAFEALRRQANLMEEPRARAAALWRAAELARGPLRRAQDAIELIDEVVALDPTHREAAAALRGLRLADGDWEGAARALEAEIAQAQGPGQKGRLLLELADLHRVHLHHELDAMVAYEQARAALGDVREVAAPLFELYLVHERLAEAAELTRALARTAPRDDPGALARDAVRYAQVALRVGDGDLALAHLEMALGAAPGHVDALRPIADLYEERQRWEDARKALSTLAGAAEAGGVKPEPALRARLGRIARLAGRHQEAQRWFESVLEDQPRHTEALRQLAAIAEGRGDLATALGLLERVDIEGDEARFNHWSRIADLAQRAQDQERYERALRAALEVKPDDHRALTRLLEVLSQRGAWHDAVEVIGRLADTAEGNPKARAKYFSAAAKIYRDKLADLERATKMFERTLDEDWTNLAEFAALDAMLTQAREYKLQERVYRHMIRRVSGNDRPELEAPLWHSLGEIYRSRLKSFAEAAEAFEVASKLEPDNAERHMILAELYQALGRSADAIGRHQELLRLQPGRVESLRAMREICSATKQYDRAFCIVSSLIARGQATQPEQEFFDQWAPRPIVKATAPLGDEDWLRHLRHPDEDPYVSGIFDTILAHVLAVRARPPKELGLGPDTAVDLAAAGSSVLAQHFLVVARVLGLRVAPQLHIVRQQPSLMTYAVTNPASSIMGGAITQVGETTRIFIMARHLAYYQGGRYMALLCPTRADLAAVLVCAVAVVTGQDGAVPPAAKKLLAHLRASLQRTPPLLERLAQMVQRFMARGGGGGKADFDAWLRGAELTACRAALLLVADPRVAAAALQADPSSPAAVSNQDRIEDLLRFVVSADYLKLRETLGVAVG